MESACASWRVAPMGYSADAAVTTNQPHERLISSSSQQSQLGLPRVADARRVFAPLAMSEGLRRAQDIGSRLLERRRKLFPLRFLRFGLQRLALRVLRTAPYLENRAYPSDAPFIVGKESSCRKNHRAERIPCTARRRRVMSAPNSGKTSVGDGGRTVYDAPTSARQFQKFVVRQYPLSLEP